MLRWLSVLVCLLFWHPEVVAQGTIGVTTFRMEELEADVASLPLPRAAGDDVRGTIEQAVRAFGRGDPQSAVSFLERFALNIRSQPVSVISTERAAGLVSYADSLVEALSDDLSLGGALVGAEGAVLEVSDRNSPVYGTRLTIPAGALSRPTFISMRVREDAPVNRALTFSASGLVLGPPGLDLTRPATLDFPYADREGDGIVDGTDLTIASLKVGAIDGSGRIAFPRRALDSDRKVQTITVYTLASYWNVGWRWDPGVLTYKLVWPTDSVALVSGALLSELADAVRAAINVWASAMEPAGVRFQEVPQNQPAAIRFGFFSTDIPLSVSTTGASSSLVPGLARGLGDGAAQVYASEDPLISGEGFAVVFNSDFGSATNSTALAWTPGHTGSSSAVSIEAVAIHALGHVMGLDDVPDRVQPPIMATGANLLNPEVCLDPDDVGALGRLYGNFDRSTPVPCPYVSIGNLPDVFDFGEVRVGSERESAFTLRNEGTGTLLLSRIDGEGDFELKPGDVPPRLGPGETATFSATFRPREPGPIEGTIRISSNAADGPVSIRLRGAAPFDLPRCTLVGSPRRITPGESLSLVWTTSGYPGTVEMDGVGMVGPGGGAITVSPTETSRYTLTASNTAGSTTCETEVEVIRATSSQIIWTTQFGTPGDDVLRAIAASGEGIYLGGEVGGTLSHAGEGFVGRYDVAGDSQWERRFGSSRVEGLVIGSSGIYVAGLTEQGLPGQTWSGGLDAFIRMYDFEGNEVWTRQFGTDEADRASAIALDPTGVYVAGVTEGALEGGGASGGLDGYVRKYSLSGDPVWLRQFGTPRDDFVRALVAAPGGVVVGGDSGAPLPGQTFGGASDAFLRFYGEGGEEIWTQQFGGAGSEFVASVAADTTGVYVAGGTETPLPGQTGRGGFDAFVRKYDVGGTEIWTRQFGTALTDSAAAIGVDSTGIFVVGVTEGTMTGQVSHGAFDAFLRAFDPGGEEIWTRYIGTSAGDDGFAVSPYRIGIYVAGSTLGTFGGYESAGATDAWVARVLK